MTETLKELQRTAHTGQWNFDELLEWYYERGLELDAAKEQIKFNEGDMRRLRLQITNLEDKYEEEAEEYGKEVQHLREEHTKTTNIIAQLTQDINNYTTRLAEAHAKITDYEQGLTEEITDHEQGLTKLTKELAEKSGETSDSYCLKHIDKEWRGSKTNCPYCEADRAKNDLRFACTEIKILEAQRNLMLKAMKEGDQIRTDIEKGKY